MSTTLKSEIILITSLAEYQTGAIVSHQIIKTSAGNVTILAFDQGQELSEHTAPFDALVHVLEGQGEIYISGKPRNIKCGEAIILPANMPHAVRATQQVKMLLTMIRA
jgi:quercetin dioxygenase-like cupin family protein